MKAIVAALFVLGSCWALFAWILLVVPLVIFMPGNRNEPRDIAFSFIGSALALLGYWIWCGWGFRWKTGRFPLVGSKSFWALSFLVHLMWAFAVPFAFRTTVAEFWSDGGLLPYSGWIALNLVVAAVGFFHDSPRSSPEPR